MLVTPKPVGASRSSIHPSIRPSPVTTSFWSLYPAVYPEWEWEALIHLITSIGILECQVYRHFRSSGVRMKLMEAHVETHLMYLNTQAVTRAQHQL